MLIYSVQQLYVRTCIAGKTISYKHVLHEPFFCLLWLRTKIIPRDNRLVYGYPLTYIYSIT
jgi:hypothetical protein